MKVSEIIIASAESLMATQRLDGSFAPGHNGPYYDDELPLRNTSHILILLLKAGELSGDSVFRNAALRALDYITASERRPMDATFWVRRNPEKDFSNGLIGQAWVIEALAYAAQDLGDDRLNALAEEVFMLHPFDEGTGRWQVVNVDGSYDAVDMTFNHQLWFAAAGGLLQGNEPVRAQVRQFLDKLGANLEIYENGLIRHALARQAHRQPALKTRLKQLIKTSLLRTGKAATSDETINKAIGYHAFNTYAFSLLYQQLKDHVFWKSETFSRILKFPLTDLYRAGVDHFVPDALGKGKVLPFNCFAYPYNPPGIELALTVQTFSERYGDGYEDLIQVWLGRQMERTFDADSGLMNRQTDDGATLAARLYEAVRLADYEVRQESEIQHGQAYK
jgi:hypothetical protein